MRNVRVLVVGITTTLVFCAFAATATAIRPPGSSPGPKSPFDDTTLFAPDPTLPGGFDESNGDLMRGASDNGRGGISFANDPCLDPPPTAPEPERRRRTVQSETDLAVLNTQGSMGKKIVVGYNDSFGFYNNRQGLSGYAYSTNGGNTFIDAGGLPPKVPTGTPAAGLGGPPGTDGYFGDPVVVAHHSTQTFWFSSIYQSTNGYFTISVNRGRFMDAPATNTVEPESVSNTRCKNDATQFGVADVPSNVKERMIWDAPMEVVKPPNLGPGNQDFLDKEWLYVDQKSGTLYVTYTRFASDGSTPIELVKCPGCAFNANPTDADWVGPFVIVPNEAFDFNQATQPVTTKTGRVLVTWIMRRFGTSPPFPEIENRIEYAISDNDGVTFGPEQTVAVVNPQREPLGYNRARLTILNAPYIVVDKGEDDGVISKQESGRAGFNNVYITYFSGKTPLPILTSTRSEADILVSTSVNNGTSFGPPVKVNDDPGTSTHIFPTVQANKHGDVYVGWTDRRNDSTNVLNERWANVSKDGGLTFGHDVVQDDVQDSWFARADARPNFGDYDSSELLGFNQFVMTWSEGKFPPLGQAGPSTNPLLRQTTPDTVFTIANGLGVGGG